MAYWDTSALVKLYVAEIDSRYFLQLLTTSNEPIVSSVVAATEVLCVLYRKEQAGALKRGGARRVYERFHAGIESGLILTIPYGRDVESEAVRLVRLAYKRPQPILVRSLDVIHVSTALTGKSRTVVATDERLRKLAQLVGLELLPQ